MPFHQWRRGLMPKGTTKGSLLGQSPGGRPWATDQATHSGRPLKLFGEEGFHQCSIARISELARCSPAVSFYQYFSGKEDVFSSLAGQVARQITASTEALDPLTPDASGWDGLRAWVGRYGDIHARYGPIFQGFPTTFKDDERLTTASARLSDQSVSRTRSKLSTSDLPDRQLDPLIAQLIACLTRTLDDAATLRDVAPGAYQRERIEVAFTDVMHRSLFGRNRFEDAARRSLHSPSSRRVWA